MFGREGGSAGNSHTHAPISPLSPQWGLASSTSTVSLPERQRERKEGSEVGSEEGRDPQAGCVRESCSEEGARAGAAANMVGLVGGGDRRLGCEIRARARSVEAAPGKLGVRTCMRS